MQHFKEQKEIAESEELQMWLATHNAILTTVKSNIQKVPAFEDLMCDVVICCVQMYEAQTYLLPSEKHGIVEVCSSFQFCCSLLQCLASFL